MIYFLYQLGDWLLKFSFQMERFFIRGNIMENRENYENKKYEVLAKAKQLRLIFENDYQKYFKIAPMLNELHQMVDSDPALLYSHIQNVTTNSDIEFINRLLAAFMYIQRPNDKEIIEVLQENIDAALEDINTLGSK